MKTATAAWLNQAAKAKTDMLQEMFAMEPIHVDVIDPKTKKPRPRCQGEDLIYLWDKIYASDPMAKSIVVETVTGPSTPNCDYVDNPSANPVFPYEQLRALVGDGGKWKWPGIWKNLDLLPRRGKAWRHIDDPTNLGKIENPNPHIVPLSCLVVGGGPVGLRLAIELALGGHRVTVFEKRREVIHPETGQYESVGFTNRVNRPHINNFCRNDLDRMNGRNFMTAKMCYPVFTNSHTSSIGIDECQMLLLKTALLLGVNFELGVGYGNASAVNIDTECNQRPRWKVEYTADEVAQERYGKNPAGEEIFDALFGCDGGQSRVRDSQEKWLGKPKTRVYKKMFGVVSNLRKCSRSKLKELGFVSGLEPEDRAGAQTNVFFYKASYHNYLIVHPTLEEMEANGIPWKSVFSFDKARENPNDEKTQLKAVLKKYVTKKARTLGIPIDESLPNDGFVEAPNDVMAFDFSEFYNCEKSACAMVPPLDWDFRTNGEWETFCPLVALAGDSVADPNWLQGVGLQRGWNSAMDATFYADNLYNNKSFNGRPPDKENPIEGPVEWMRHMDNMMNLMYQLGCAARESRLSREMETGTFDEKSPVLLQIARHFKARNTDPPEPSFLPNVEPWGRYQEFQLAVNKNFKGRALFENKHPIAVRELAIHSLNERFVERGAWIGRTVTRPTGAMLSWTKRFTCSAFWGMMKLLEIDGKAVADASPNSTTTCADSPELNASKSDKSLDNNGPKRRAAVREKPTAKPMPVSDRTNEAANGSLETIASHIATKSQSHAKSSVADCHLSDGKDVLNYPAPYPVSDDKPKLAPAENRLAATSPVVALHPLRELQLNEIRAQRVILRAKSLEVEAELKKLQCEQEAVAARLARARTELEMLNSLLGAYEHAEVNLSIKL